MRSLCWCAAAVAAVVFSCSVVNAPHDPEPPNDEQGGAGGAGAASGCVPPYDTLDNCGACASPCEPMNVNGATCESETCSFGSCVPGFSDCDGDKSNGCETATDTDPLNCAACGFACATNAAFLNVLGWACSAGQCDYTDCAQAWADCDNDRLNGCEKPANTLTDCGDCSRVCQPANATTASCTTGTCAYGSCVAPFRDCDSDTYNGCETNSSSDEMHCGSCNNVCNMGDSCISGGCTNIGPSCNALKMANPNLSSGNYTIDPNGGPNADAFQVYCDMTQDGGGWTLVAWTGNSAVSPYGVPYPGLAPCPSLTCPRGSIAAPPGPQQLIAQATSLAQAQSTSVMTSFGPMASYQYAGKHVYSSLSSLTLNYGATSCVGHVQGTFTMLIGPTSLNGSATYLAQALAYSSYDYSSDGNSYIWNIGEPNTYCQGSGSPPGSWMGTWSTTQYGPNLANTPGAYSVWVR